MESVDRVEKKGYNDFHKYNYVLEADLISAVRVSLIAEGVFVTCSVVGQTHEGNLTLVNTKHRFINADDATDFVEVDGQGQGNDSGDKGGYKAITGAMKYFLMKNFLIATGDDPENDEGTTHKIKLPKKLIKSPAIKKNVEEEDEETEDEEEEEEEEEEASDEKLTAKDDKILAVIIKEYREGKHLSEEEFFDKLKK